MAHDVFVSYSTQDKSVADAMCHHLEARHIRCWVAPRDVPPGANFAGSIVKAIRESRVMVLVYSESSNRSPHVLNEVNTAVAKGVMIIPFRIENAALSEDMEYYLGAPHWLDALTEPLEEHLGRLSDRIDALLATFPNTAHEIAKPTKAKPVQAESAAPQKITDPLAMQLQQIKEAEARKQAQALAAVRLQLAEQIKCRKFAEARQTAVQLLTLQPGDPDVETAKAVIERELELEAKRLALEAQRQKVEKARQQQEIERNRREQEQREAEERRRQDEDRRRVEAEQRRKEQEQREAAERERQQQILTLRQKLKDQYQQGAYADAQTTVVELEGLGCSDFDANAARSFIANRLTEQANIARFKVCSGEVGDVDHLSFGPDRFRFGSDLLFYTDNSYHNVGSLYGHRGDVECVAAFPGGTRVVSCAADGSLIVWDIGEGLGVKPGTIQFTLRGHSGRVNCLTVSPGGRYVVSGGCDGLIAIWNLETQKCVRVLTDNSPEYLQALTMLPDGKRLVSASRGIKVWNLATAKVLHCLDLGYTVNCIALHPDGVHAIAGGDASTTIWDLETGLNIREIPQGSQSVAVLPDGRGVLVHALHPGVSVWNLLSGNLLLNVKGVRGKTECVAMAPDGHRAVAGMNDGRVVIWDTQTGKQLHTFDREAGHRKAVTCVAAFATEKYYLAVSGSLDQNVLLWRLPR
ncbi:MAG: TIR domain-containing protein [Candidatus Hydrogenedentes bacterium]|nr:TIR domain-containing protein [Candidatus Hydrogenedentota bacterium]